MHIRKHLLHHIDNASLFMDHNLIHQKILNNINNSDLISDQIKYRINFGNHSNLNNIRLQNYLSTQNDTQDLLLCELNHYDAKLITLLVKHNVDLDIIITLLIMNNRQDINYLCQKMINNRDICHNILTLKKLSALYKIENNFSI